MKDAQCMKCKQKRTWKTKPTLVKTKNNRFALSGKCNVCDTKMLRFISKSEIQNGKGLLSSIIGKPIPILSKIPLLSALF